MHYRQIHYISGYEKSNLKSWIIGDLYLKILACLEKDPSWVRKSLELSFLRPDLNFFLEFLIFFLIHHKLYPQDNHSLKFFVKKSRFSIFFSTIFFTNFVVKFFWQIFFTKKLFWMVILRAMLMLNWIFFKNSEKKLYQALKNIVLDVSWSNQGLFSNKQVFFHIDFILSSIHPD